jgi:nucleoside-diphosphate-sugar epimerase
MSLRGARVLLTGGTGFIGSRLAAALHEAGADVRLLVRASSQGGLLGPLWRRLPRLTADLGDPASLAAAVRAADPELVFHLAKEREGASFEREARASVALAAALAASAPRLKRWVRTAHAAREGLGRGADAELARALAARHALHVVTLELRLVYGPGQRAGDFPRALVEAALAGRPLAAPEEAKDLVYVGDVAEAYARAAAAPGAEGAWIPIGSGRLVSGAEATRAAAKAAKRRPEDVLPPRGEPRAGGHPADTAPARALLGWSARTSLDAGMAHLVRWLRAERRSRRG